MTAAIIQLLDGTSTWSQQAVDPPRRPQPWVAIALLTITIQALLPRAADLG